MQHALGFTGRTRGIEDEQGIFRSHPLCGAEAKQTKKPKRCIKQWTKADWDAIRQDSSKFRDEFLPGYQEKDVDANYNDFCNHINNVIKQHVPSKTRGTRWNVPWLTPNIKRMTRKKQRLFNRAKKTCKEQHRAQYKSYKKATSKAIKEARWTYISGILQTSLDEGNSKPFWRYIYSQKNDRTGVAPLRDKSDLVSDSKLKAEILNNQFTSVFTVEDPSSSETTLEGPSYPPINKLEINPKGARNY